MSDRTSGNLQLAKSKLSLPLSEEIVSSEYDANLEAIDAAVSAEGGTFGDDPSLVPVELPLNGQFNVFIKDREAAPNNARYGFQVLNYNTIDGSATGANFAAVVSATNAGAVGSDHYAFSVGSNNVAQLWSEYVFCHHASTGTADEMVGVYIDTLDKAGGAGAVTSAKGIHIEPQTVAAINIALDIGNMGSGTALKVAGGASDLGPNSTKVGQLLITAPSVPASASATGVAGAVAWDSGFVYVCISTNTWKRAALSTW